MKKLFGALLLVAIGLGSMAKAQTLQTFSFPSPPSNKARPAHIVNVWLPEDYSKANHYPILFVFQKGDDKLVAEVADYYARTLRTTPPVIVVGLSVGLDDLGFSYQTGGVNEAGEAFADFWLNQLPEFLSKRFSLAKYRAVVGHSYSSNYTDYLLKKHPGVFNGYACMTPEQPEYKLDYAALVPALPNPFFYYLASAGQDMERREKHATAIAEQLKRLDSVRFHFHHEDVPEADHLTSTPRTIGAALEFLFSGFQDYGYTPADGKLSTWFESLRTRIEGLYGFGIERNSSNAAYFCGLAVEQKDLESLRNFDRYFITDQASASILFNAGQAYFDLGDITRATQLYQASIAKGQKTNAPDFVLMSYRTLALHVYSEHDQAPEKAWRELEDGYSHTGDVAFKYYFGMISARHSYRLADGIQNLQEFAKERDQSTFGRLYTLDATYVLLAKCYLASGDKTEAKQYVSKALSLNPANEDAKTLQTQLGN